ncbi:hypothetical protein GL213_00140 [Halogeometricum borinquense]|uniref:Uncharacterized protein n=1 Tax=Halogeometricum borinquense TaxID=60847 RepID=A0A6C0UGP1_9EURY|nr:hypothetical protein [Halogeometricum borinquense]QIB72949.1 hypothetical protein G3I44_00805 [Halogeometricum borinquense]QIQ75091.1 hypothetical protein GL213_00140 [Halogeometricum borinquense]
MRVTFRRIGVALFAAMLVLTAFSGGAAALADDASNNVNVASNYATVQQNSGNLGWNGGVAAVNLNNAQVTQVSVSTQNNIDVL